MTTLNEIATSSDISRLEQLIVDLTSRLDKSGLRPANEWLSIPQMAREKGVSEATVRRWAREGEIDARGAGKRREVRLR